MAFKVPEKHRIKSGGYMATSSLDGNNGIFLIPVKIQVKKNEHKNYYLSCVVTTSAGWENVLISTMNEDGKLVPRFPNPEEIALVKAMFWDKEDTVVQFLPAAKLEMVVPMFCVALWRPTFLPMPTPPKEFISFKGKDTPPPMQLIKP